MCKVGNKRMLELTQNSNCLSFGGEPNRKHRSVTRLQPKQKDMDKGMTDMF